MQETSYMALAGLKKGGRDPMFYKSDKVDFIIKVVCNWFDVEEERLSHKTRVREVVLPRQIAMTLISRHTNLGLKRIGGLFGSRDHTTVIHSKMAVMNLYQTDEKFRETFDLLERKIQ